MADDPIIKEAMDAFETISTHEADNRKDWSDDIDFALNENQWPERIRKERELEGRPVLTISKLAAMGRQVVNDARQNKPGIVVHPADSEADPETAEVFNGLIKNIEVSSNAEVAYDTALEHAVFGGFGYFRVNTAYASDDTFDQDIVIERIANPLSVYGDCYSTAADSSDWNTCFVVETLTKKAFEKTYKGAEPVNWKEDWRNVSPPWLDDDYVQVAEYWTREEAMRNIVLLSDQSVMDAREYAEQRDLFMALGKEVVGERAVKSHKVVQRVLSGVEELSKVEWAGRYIPIIPVYGSEVNFKGKRSFRSLIRGSKDGQRMFNYWRTTSTELVALAPKAPFIGRKGAFETDAQKWATANTQSHAFLEYDGPEPPQRQPFAGVPAGAMQEALNAADDIKATMGIYDASIGARSNETSGKAIIARQMEGDVATFHFIDNLSRAIRHCGRILIDLIPSVYSVPRMVRVLGPENEPHMVPVNQPFREQAGPGGMTQRIPLGQQPQQGQGVAEQGGNGEGEGPNEELEDIVKVYDLSVGKYDCIVKAGPSFNTRREQTVQMLTELIRAFPNAAPVLADIMAKNLDMPEADEIKDRLEALLPPQIKQGSVPAEAVQQLQQGAQQLQGQLQQAQAQMQALAQENEQLKQANDLKARELDIKAFDAATKRIQATKPEMVRTDA